MLCTQEVGICRTSRGGGRHSVFRFASETHWHVDRADCSNCSGKIEVRLAVSIHVERMQDWSSVSSSKPDLLILRRNPLVGYTSVPAVALATAAAVDWHGTLRFLGVSATLFTIAARVTSYSSPQVMQRLWQACPVQVAEQQTICTDRLLIVHISAYDFPSSAVSPLTGCRRRCQRCLWTSERCCQCADQPAHICSAEGDTCRSFRQPHCI